jgi:hypothetical protein
MTVMLCFCVVSGDVIACCFTSNAGLMLELARTRLRERA